VKIRVLRLILCLALVVSTITAVMVATPAAATSATTSITITRWGANSTILFQETIDYTAMQGNFSVKGDGTTHYCLEGPNYPWSGYPDLWDANETENLKDKGALEGTDLKDLCMWAGEADGLGNSTDTIKVTAADGFYTTLPYANVYNPPAVQGPAVICWWWNGDYTGQGTFTTGMRLIFFAQTTNGNGSYVYGDYDMGQTMPAAYQYFNYAQNLPNYPLAAYPSTDGLATKYVSNIDIYSTEVPSWTLQLDGTAIGGANYTMTQQFFAEGLAHHGAAQWLDTAWGGNNTYSGMPLWLLCGWVDDAVQHGPDAFNDALAAAGYIVKVTDVTGNYTVSLASQDVASSNNFIIANQKNGGALTGSEYPLRLVGAGLSTKGQVVKQVAKIQLLPGNTLTMGVSGSGNTTPAVGNHTYVASTQVNISATAASGWQFAGWTGAVGNSTNPNTTVTMDGNKTVTANFTQVTPTPTPTPTPTSEGNALLNVTANVVPPMIGISLDKDSIDFGNVTPCGNSTPVPVGIYNISSPGFGVNVTAQVQGNATAQDFYGQSLYINDAQYNPATVIAHISSGSSQSVVTQLRVPCTWNTNGNQTATIIFWASKS